MVYILNCCIISHNTQQNVLKIWKADVKLSQSKFDWIYLLEAYQDVVSKNLSTFLFSLCVSSRTLKFLVLFFSFGFFFGNETYARHCSLNILSVWVSVLTNSWIKYFFSYTSKCNVLEYINVGIDLRAFELAIFFDYSGQKLRICGKILSYLNKVCCKLPLTKV